MHPPNQKAAPAERGPQNDDPPLGTMLIDEAESNRSSTQAQRSCSHCGELFTARAAGRPQKFCSPVCRRNHHDAKPARAKRAQTCGGVSELVPVPAPPEPKQPAYSPSREFDWIADAEDVVQGNYRRVAVYQNPDGDICIRSERDWDQDEDSLIIVSREHLPRLLRTLEALL